MAGRRTSDTTIWSEDSDFSATVDSDNDLHTKSKLWDGTDEVTVTDDRLDVNAKVTRHPQPVREWETYSNANTKCSYTVPSGKVLYVLYVRVVYGDDATGDMVYEFQENGDERGFMQINVPESTTDELVMPQSVPLGPYTAGQTVRIQRVAGDNDDWAGMWHGYLEDA